MSDDDAVCGLTDGCITCGDVAVVLTVVDVLGADAVCRAADDRTERVATELLSGVRVGDRLLVHAGVALSFVPSQEVTDAVRR